VVSITREDYVRTVVARALDLVLPAPAGFWDGGASWALLNQWTDTYGTNAAADDFLAGRIGKAAFDVVMKQWLELWWLLYRHHEQGSPS
jgi:hypothetical protein